MNLAGKRDFRIAVIPGDGIGREVIPAARQVLERAGQIHGARFSFHDFDWGSDYYFANGEMMPGDALSRLARSDAILLGAVGHPEVQDHITLDGLLLPIRRGFDQYANVRPAILFPGIKSPLSAVRSAADPESNPEIDMVIVRENTEGEYSQVGGSVYGGQPAEVAIQTSVFTRRGTERIIRFAFELAVKRNGKKRVTSITKSNAQGFSMVLWDRVFKNVAREFPGIATESLLVDRAAMDFVRRPQTFDVVVASNLFGDILSDLSAALAGSIGLAASANLDPSKRHPSMFEPVHGSAPDIAGKGIANPIAAVLSAAMMLDHLDLPDAARSLDKAIRAVLAKGTALTPDLGGAQTTAQVTAAILAELR